MILGYSIGWLLLGLIALTIYLLRPEHEPDERGFCHARDCHSPGCGYQLDPMMLTDTSGTSPAHKEQS